MHIELLPDTAQQLLSKDRAAEPDAVLAYWRHDLETPIADLKALVAKVQATLRRKEVPYSIVAGHQWDAATTQQLNDAVISRV